MPFREPRLRVLCAEPQHFSEAGLQAMGAVTELTSRALSQAAFARAAAAYDALMVRLTLRVTGDMVAKADRLKAIISPTTGLDHIDLEAAAGRRVAIFSLQGQTAFLRGVTSSAEHTFALLLSLVRAIPAASASVARGEWTPARFRGMELRGKTLGLIGCGRIGQLVAGYGRAFGMRVLGYDPHLTRWPRAIERRLSLKRLLQASDIVSLHAPLNRTTERMIGSREIAWMRRGARLINTSRGAVLDEPALLRGLRNGQVGGAALDVLADEPGRGKARPLIAYARTHVNLLITPHIAGAAREAVEATDLFVVHRFRDWLDHRR